jgi:hypothetical protein
MAPTTAHISEPVPVAVLPPLAPPRLDSSIPMHVSVAVSPFRLGLGDPSTLQRVSRAVSPIPIRIFDLLPSDFPFSDLSEDSEEPNIIYKTPAPLSTRDITPGLELKSEEKI